MLSSKATWGIPQSIYNTKVCNILYKKYCTKAYSQWQISTVNYSAIVNQNDWDIGPMRFHSGQGYQAWHIQQNVLSHVIFAPG